MSNKPIMNYKIGNVSCSVFKNYIDDKPSYSHSFQKSYKDKSGNWKYSTSFSDVDLRNLHCLVGALINKQLIEKDLSSGEVEETSSSDPF